MGEQFVQLEKWGIDLMRKRSEQISYKKIFIRTFGMFIIFYIVVMIIFTGIQSSNNRIGFNKACDQLIDKVEKDLMETVQNMDMVYEELFKQYGEFVTKEEFVVMQEGDLAERINNYVQGFYSGAYAKIGIYDEHKKEWTAKSGSYLYSGGKISLRTGRKVLSGEDRECLVTNRYINLEDYLDFDQLAYLRQLYVERTNERSYYCKVKGYRKGSEIIPEVIELYEQHYEEDGQTRELIDETLLKIYEFEVVPSVGMVIYENEASVFIFEDLFDMESILKSIPWRFDKNTDKYFQECTKAFEIPYLYEGLRSDNVYLSSIIKEVEDTGVKYGTHYISLYAIYFPWQVAMNQLIYVYLFSLIVVMLLVAILSKQLWKIYQKQEALDKGRRLLVDGISHELKTPLSLIRAYSEGLKEKISEEKRDDYLAVIIEETYKMDEMVLEMLDLSQLETEAYMLKRQEVKLNQLIEKEKESKQKLLDDRSIQVIFEADRTYCIEVDEKRIVQVISSLLMNAILHTPEKGIITIRLQNNRLEIENEGKPISETQRQHIWEAFYKGDTTVMDYQKGNGLGLAIVSEILKLHQFKFGVENTLRGVKFWFVFIQDSK